jgi:hypothetical protein
MNAPVVSEESAVITGEPLACLHARYDGALNLCPVSAYRVGPDTLKAQWRCRQWILWRERYDELVRTPVRSPEEAEAKFEALQLMQLARP